MVGCDIILLLLLLFDRVGRDNAVQGSLIRPRLITDSHKQHNSSSRIELWLCQKKNYVMEQDSPPLPYTVIAVPMINPASPWYLLPLEADWHKHSFILELLLCQLWLSVISLGRIRDPCTAHINCDIGFFGFAMFYLIAKGDSRVQELLSLWGSVGNVEPNVEPFCQCIIHLIIISFFFLRTTVKSSCLLVLWWVSLQGNLFIFKFSSLKLHISPKLQISSKLQIKIYPYFSLEEVSNQLLPLAYWHIFSSFCTTTEHFGWSPEGNGRIMTVAWSSSSFCTRVALG